jgi:hypothetical protein
MSNAGFTGERASYASTEKQMAAFDRLPCSVRAALADAAFNWAAYTLHRQFEAGGYSVKDLIKQIDAWDRKQIARDRTRVWGVEPARLPKARSRRQPS